MRFWIFTFIFSMSLNVLAAEAKTTETAVPAAETAAVVTTAAPTDSKIKTDNRQESEIALNLDGNKKATAGDSPLFRILFSIAVMGMLGVGAFVFLRKYAIPKAMKSQTQIKVLQQHFLGPKKSLAIVRVAGESILIGITDQNISMIKSLSLIDDEVPEESPSYFAHAMSGMAVKEEAAEAAEAGEDFSFGGIKDVVSKRLRGMRNLE